MRFLALSLFLALALHGSGIDSGGGKSSVGTFNNHGSIGAMTTSGTASASYLRSHAGLIEVLYAVPTTDALDSDNDNMPDAWEEVNGLNVGVDDSALDKDEDGSTNLMEYRASSDPDNANSFYLPALVQSGVTSTISMQSVLGRNYRLYVSKDLNTWEVWDNISGTGSTIAFNFDQSSPAALSLLNATELPKCFFRIELNIAP
jgi:hypothetical protein